MTRRFIRYSAMTALAVALVWSLPAGAVAQNAGGGQTQAGAGNEPAAPTPRSSDGHPDLTGLWVRGGGGGNVSAPDLSAALTVLTKGRPCAPGQGECAPGVNFERDSGDRKSVV